MLPKTLQMVEDAGHAVFTRGQYNLNIVGIRTPPSQPNTFDDELHLVFKDHTDTWVDLSFQCTTDPGLYYLRNPMNVNGTAILKPGQYRGSHKIGQHRGQYTALVQASPVTVYRDRNRNDTMDLLAGQTQTGTFGINIHHAGTDSKLVGRWSAGCTVVANLHDWDILMAIVRRSADLYGDRFTYTLIDRDGTWQQPK